MRKLFFSLTETWKTCRSSKKWTFRLKKHPFSSIDQKWHVNPAPDNHFWAHIYMISTQNFTRNKIFLLTEVKKIYPESEKWIFCWNFQRNAFISLIWNKLFFKPTYLNAKFDGENTFFHVSFQENSFKGSKMRFFAKKHPFLTKIGQKQG